MRILFDGYHWLDGPPSGRLTVREIVGAWQRSFDDEVVVALPRRPRPGEQAALDDVGARWVRTFLPTHPLRTGIELAARGRSVDWVVGANFSPWWGRSSVFLHDAIFRTSPQWFGRVERVYLSLYPPLATRATVRFTSSRTERRRLEDLYPALRPIHPVGLGVSRELLEVDPVAVAGLVPGEFWLSVGRLNARKNLARTVVAALAAGVVDAGSPLVVVGERDGRDEQSDPVVERARADGSVRHTGRVSPAQLSWLYRHAARFVYLSLDEGYGLPPLEARAFGTPVVVSDISVFHETLGTADGVRYVDPTDHEAIVRAFREPLSRPTAAPTPPSWDDTVRAMRAVLESHENCSASTEGLP